MLFSKNISEIRADRALTLYGAALAAAYFATAVFLFAHDHYLSTFSRQVEPICWPYFESCYKYRVWSNADVRIGVLLFGALTLLPLFAFLRQKVALGYYSLVAVALLQVGMIVQDFRNTQNQYYMLMWVVFAYLLWPSKRRTLHYLVLSFYFWAGRLKLNWQWLSGHNLYAKLWLIPERFNSAACVYVVILEMLVIWGLLSRSRAWFWATIFQLALFHFISISQIGTYYPALMFAILAIYPLARLIPAPDQDGRAGYWSTLRPVGAVLIGAFAFFQIYPSLASKNRVLSGVGRTFALNMFESRYDCDAYWVEHYKDGRASRVEAQDKSTERIHCEPIYYYSKTMNRCRTGAIDPGFEDLDFFMTIGLKGEKQESVIHRTGFCTARPGFNLFLPNSWIED